MPPPYKIFSYTLLLFLTACNASDKASDYEDTDSAHGPRIDKEHMQAPPVKDTATTPKKRDSASLRVSPPGETDTTKLNIQ
ncbi:MAG: hypothetical protein WC756_14725 [Taibaiella sp.]